MFDGIREKSTIALYDDPETIEELVQRLDGVIAFFSDKQAWCKGVFSKKENQRIRMCLEQALMAHRVFRSARVPIMDAIEERYGSRPYHIAWWNDGWFRRFKHVRTVLELTRANLVAGKYHIDELVLRI